MKKNNTTREWEMLSDNNGVSSLQMVSMVLIEHKFNLINRKLDLPSNKMPWPCRDLKVKKVNLRSSLKPDTSLNNWCQSLHKPNKLVKCQIAKLSEWLYKTLKWQNIKSKRSLMRPSKPLQTWTSLRSSWKSIKETNPRMKSSISTKKNSTKTSLEPTSKKKSSRPLTRSSCKLSHLSKR